MNKYILNNFYINLTIITAVSIIVLLLNNGQINRDGVLYINQAYLLLNDFEKAKNIFDWPFFSFLILFIHQFTGLSIQYSAHFINILLFIIACSFFLKSINFLSSNKIPLIFGTIVLLASTPIFDDYLVMILRDHGQWAGFMMGFYFYLKWIDRPSFLRGFLWQLGFLLGALFRVECLIFNLLLPLMSFTFPKSEPKLKIVLQSVSLTGILFIILITFIYTKANGMFDYLLARFQSIFIHSQNFFSPLPVITDNYYLSILIEKYDQSFKFIFLFYIISIKWFFGLGPLYLFLVWVALYKKQLPLNYSLSFFIFFIISFSVCFLHLLTTFVITGRYMIINWWIIYLIATFGLNYFVKRKIANNKYIENILKYLIFGLFLINFLNIFIDKNNFNYSKEVSTWIDENKIDLNDIFFNDARTAFYSGIYLYSDFYKKNREFEYNRYLVINYKYLNNDINFDNYDPIKFFPNEDNPKFIIYKIKN